MSFGKTIRSKQLFNYEKLKWTKINRNLKTQTSRSFKHQKISVIVILTCAFGPERAALRTGKANDIIVSDAKYRNDPEVVECATTQT